MARIEKKGFGISIKEATEEFISYVMEDKPMFSYVGPLVFLAWVIERWLLPFSYWVPLGLAVWATVQYGKYQRHLLLENLNKRWKQVILYTSPITPLEQCEWLNKFLMEVWPNCISPKLSKKFSFIVEKRLKYRKPRFIESIELLDFSLGSCPPNLGLHGTRWSTSGDQRILRMGFEWDTSNVNIILLAKMAKPLVGTARIGINSLHIKGELLLMPILDGQAVLYSFESPPEVRIGIAFGSGGSQTLPATELPGVSSWLDKLFTDTMVKTMVEPHRRCYSLPAIDLRKRAVGGILSVTVISASELVKGNLKGNNSGKQQGLVRNGSSESNHGDEDRKTFVEVELGELTRRTTASLGSSPKWDKNFKMVLHEDNGILKFHLYELIPNNMKPEYITNCEIKVKYAADDSTTFWAVGLGSSVLAKRAESVGEEVEMVVPFEGINSGKLTVRLVLKEWTFSDGSSSLNNPSQLTSQQSIYGPINIQPKTGRKLKITVMEGRDLIGKDKFGKCDPYIKLQYGKSLYRTRTILHDANPTWNQIFEFDEIAGGEYLNIKCYGQDIFSDDSIGSARVNLEGLVEGSLRDIWVPLEKVSTGELRLQIEAVINDAYDRSRTAAGGSGSGWIELSLIEAKDLIAADFRGTSDPYVRVQYGKLKKRTKVIYKTLSPQWNQTLDFPDDGSPLLLYVKDHNSVLPTSSIGHCNVEYHRLPPNEMADRWIPLQGVTKGEIHVQITRKVPEIPKKSSMNLVITSLSKAQQISGQVRETMAKLKTLVEDGDFEGVSSTLNEMESLEDVQEEYMVQLETEETLLINKISELGEEINKSSPHPRQQIPRYKPSNPPLRHRNSNLHAANSEFCHLPIFPKLTFSRKPMKSAPIFAFLKKKWKNIEGVSEEMNTIASQKLDFAPARRRVRSAFIEAQEQLDHPLFKLAPLGIRTEEWYEINSKGLEIFCKSWSPNLGVRSKGIVFFCHGYGDTCTFFFEGIAKRIAASGYAVFSVDHPGFGLSGGLHGYIPSFDEIVNNVIERFMIMKGKPEVSQLPRFLLGQSMGGAVALKAHLKRPTEWDGVVLIAPMCKIAEDVIPAPAILKIMTVMSNFLPTAKLTPVTDLAELAFREPSKKKLAVYNVISYSDQMRLKTAMELLKATREIESQVDKVSSPLLILHGAADKVTDPQVSQFLYEKASSNDKTLKLYPEGYHCILEGEPDERIFTVLDDIVSWLDSRCGLI